MKLNELQYRIAQQQSEAKANAQARASENAQLVQNQITKNVVVPVIPTGYFPIKKSLHSVEFTFETLASTPTTVFRQKWASYTVPTGENLLFAPFEDWDTSGYFYAECLTSGSADINKCIISVDLTDRTERNIYGTIIEFGTYILNSMNPADREQRAYFMNTRPLQCQDGDKVMVYVECTGTIANTVSNTTSYFGFELYELIRAG